MAKPNRVFPSWKKTRKGDRMPGEKQPTPKTIFTPKVVARIDAVIDGVVQDYSAALQELSE